MEQKLSKLLIAVVSSLTSWLIIDRLIISIDLFHYFLIELVITLAREFYEWQMKKLGYEKKN